MADRPNMAAVWGGPDTCSLGGPLKAEEDEITNTRLDTGPREGMCKYGVLECKLPGVTWDLVSGPDLWLRVSPYRAGPGCQVVEVLSPLPCGPQAPILSF